MCSKFASYGFLKLTITSELPFKIELHIFYLADLSNWMETFRDKMDAKSYQLIFEALAANQFTSSRLQLKLLTSDQIASLFYG